MTPVAPQGSLKEYRSVDIGDIVTLSFLIAGIGLVLSEIKLPGIVAVFAGAAAILTAALRWFGIVEGIPESFLLWMVSSVVLVVALRGTVKKYFPADESHGEVDEDLEAYGMVVDVLEDCPEAGEGISAGRISFDGSTWPAFSTGGVLRAGTQARLVYRRNLSWFLEPAQTLEEGIEPVVVPLAQEAETEKV